MRLVFRVLGTWLLALAVILAVIDGTRSLAAGSLVVTPFGDNWRQLNAQSIDVTREFVASRLFGPVLQQVFEAVLSYPGWAVLAVPGLILAAVGRVRTKRRFVRSEQI